MKGARTMKLVIYIIVLVWRAIKSTKTSVNYNQPSHILVRNSLNDLKKQIMEIIVRNHILLILGCSYECHNYANCVQVDQNNYECRCYSGYRGNGVTQCERFVEGCTKNSCPTNAECKYIGNTLKCACVQVIKYAKILPIFNITYIFITLNNFLF